MLQRCQNEDELLRELKRVLPSGGIVHTEYHVMKNLTQLGVGDLVVEYERAVWVVEVKHIDLSAHGRNASTKRTHKRKLVQNQALRYAAWRRLKTHDVSKKVRAAVFTNEGGLQFVADNVTRPQALAICLQAVKDLNQPHVFYDLISRITAELARVAHQ